MAIDFDKATIRYGEYGQYTTEQTGKPDALAIIAEAQRQADQCAENGTPWHRMEFDGKAAAFSRDGEFFTFIRL